MTRNIEGNLTTGFSGLHGSLPQPAAVPHDGPLAPPAADRLSGSAFADAQVAEQADDFFAAGLAVAGLVHALVAGRALGLVALQDPVDVVALGVLAPDELAGGFVVGEGLRFDRVAGKTDAWMFDERVYQIRKMIS
jgi:hypothetical protein